MKVYNLACHLDHHFEGWFASEADALSQQETGLLTCPVCDSKEIVRLPSAPRISKRASRELVPANQSPAQANNTDGMNSSAGQSMVLTGSEQAHFQAQVQATVMKAMRESSLIRLKMLVTTLLKKPEKYTTKRHQKEVFVAMPRLMKRLSFAKRVLRWFLYRSFRP
jgi:hypothetical protein